MIPGWIINILASMGGVTDAQLQEIEQKGLPATSKLIALINQNQALINQTVALTNKILPLVNEAEKEWKDIGPSAQIIINAIQKNLNQQS